MFMPPTSLTSMATATAGAPTNGTPIRETFHKFFESWIVDQNRNLQELISASKNHHDSSSGGGGGATQLQPLISRVIRHYEEYYRYKAECAEIDVLPMLCPTWRSSLEEAFVWIGGWRPSMAFHLLYSKSGLQVEAQLAALVQGLCTGDLADLSAVQLSQVDELQKKTIREEKDITEKMAKHQESIADTSTVELSHVVTEMLHDPSAAENNVVPESIEHQVEQTLATKEQGVAELLRRADELRIGTLRAIVNILTPIQAVHFLIAAAELHLRLHEWGKKRDMAAANQRGAPGGL